MLLQKMCCSSCGLVLVSFLYFGMVVVSCNFTDTHDNGAGRKDAALYQVTVNENKFDLENCMDTILNRDYNEGKKKARNTG